MVMTSPVPNQPNHPWYQKVNHIRIPQTAESKGFLDADLVGGDVSPDLGAKIKALFSAGQQGIWYDVTDLSTMFKDTAGTIPITANSQAVALIKDKSGRGNDASQATGSLQALFRTPASRVLYDRVDDFHTVTVPAGGWVGTMVLGTNLGTLSYDVNIPAGPYTIGSLSGLYFPGNSIMGLVIRNGTLSAAEIADCKNFMINNGANATTYGAASSFNNYWRNRTEIVGLFPSITTDLLTISTNAFNGCSNIVTFPVIQFSSAVTTFGAAFINCTKLANFPSHAFDLCNICTNYTNAFNGCALTQQSVNDILVSIDFANAPGAGTLNITGGTSAAPSGAGLTAKNNLIAKGWTVVTN